MDIQFDIASILAVLALVQILILMVYLLARKDRHWIHWCLTVFLLALGYDLFHRVIIDSRLILNTPLLIGTGSMFIFIYGPLIYFVARLVTTPHYRFRTLHLLHFTPFFINLVFFLSTKTGDGIARDLDIVTDYLSEVEKNPVLKYEYVMEPSLYLRNLLIYTLHPLIYTLLSFRLVKGRKIDKRFNLSTYIPWVRTFIYGFMAILIISELASLSAMILKKDIWYLDGFIIWRPLFVFVILFIALWKPFAAVRRPKSYEMSSSQSEFIKELERYMKEHKPFKRLDLSRYQLAEAMAVGPEYLTMVINQELGMNFKEFINRYRVMEVKDLIDNGYLERLTLDAIGEEAGFSARSTFFRVFRQLEGITPIMYRNVGIKDTKMS